MSRYSLVLKFLPGATSHKVHVAIVHVLFAQTRTSIVLVHPSLSDTLSLQEKSSLQMKGWLRSSCNLNVWPKSTNCRLRFSVEWCTWLITLAELRLILFLYFFRSIVRISNLSSKFTSKFDGIGCQDPCLYIYFNLCLLYFGMILLLLIFAAATAAADFFSQYSLFSEFLY